MTQPPLARLGPAIRKFRESRGISAKGLAAKASMSPGHLSELEQGRRNLTATLCERLAAVFSLDSNAFVQQLSDLTEIYGNSVPTCNVHEALFPSHVLNTDLSNDYRELSVNLVKTIPKSEAWDLVRKFTVAAEAGDPMAARCAKALINILSELP